jgi:hypothetical protein
MIDRTAVLSDGYPTQQLFFAWRNFQNFENSLALLQHSERDRR